MGAQFLEDEPLPQLTGDSAELREGNAPVSIEEYNLELDAAMKRMDAGEFYTHEQVVEMSKSWLGRK